MSLSPISSGSHDVLNAVPFASFHIVGSQLLVWLYAGLTTANTAVCLLIRFSSLT